MLGVWLVLIVLFLDVYWVGKDIIRIRNKSPFADL